jgi:hypothetical protein
LLTLWNALSIWNCNCSPIDLSNFDFSIAPLWRHERFISPDCAFYGMITCSASHCSSKSTPARIHDYFWGVLLHSAHFSRCKWA